MPYNGSGGFTRVMNWQADAAAGTKIKADRHDQEDDNFASGLGNAICKDGQSSPTADIPFNAKKITNLGAPVNPTDAATRGYADGIRNFSSAISITGSTPESRLKFTGTTGPWGDSYVTADMAFGVRGTSWVWNDKADFTGTDVMTLSDAGVLTTAMGTTSTFIQRQIKTTTGAISLHADTRAFLVEVQGGGGGGGTCPGAGAASTAQAGSGGGAGGYCSKWIVRPAGGYSPACTVGAASAASAAGNGSQFVDGTSTLTTGGGAAGAIIGPAGAITTQNGGVGGTATGGDVNRAGNSGGWSMIAGATPMARGGAGGNAIYGAGGQSLNTMTAATAAAGAAGVQGGGGSGAFATTTAGGVGGGGGGAGLVIVTEFR